MLLPQLLEITRMHLIDLPQEKERTINVSYHILCRYLPALRISWVDVEFLQVVVLVRAGVDGSGDARPHGWLRHPGAG